MKKLFNFYLLLFIVGFIFISRLFYIQIYTDKYILNALNTSIKKEIIIPDRGFIFDSNHKLLVFNKSIYELVIIPILMEEKNFNVKEFCDIVGIKKNIFFQNLEKAKSYSRYLPSVFVPFLSKEKFASIQEKLYKFKGFDWIKRSIRDYNVKSSTNIFGYIGEVTDNDIKRESEYYQLGDFIGWAGIEKSCEKFLRGKKGINYWLRDKNGSIIDSYNNKKNNIKAISGSDVTLTINWNLQKYVENLMVNKKGGVVAINPKNGEILSLVSSPISNPNLLVGKNRNKEFKRLINDLNNPLFDRSIQARYSPASTFKLLIELAGLQMGVINENTNFICHNGFRYGKKRIKCISGSNHRFPINVKKAIAISCNNFFAQVYKRIVEKYPKDLKVGVNEWNKIVKSFGFDYDFPYDLISYKSRKNLIPSGDFYDKKYGKNKWNAITIISNSIGQGEVNVSPMQLANLSCIIANKGYFYIPHIIKNINNKKSIIYKKLKTKIKNKNYFNVVIDGMEKVFMVGTGRSFRCPNIKMAGKTGTSQNFIKINKKIISLPDHSIFILFAPVKNPKIAVSVIIENGGFGSNLAGPIASLVAEKYISNNIYRKDIEKRIIKSNLQKIYDSIYKIKKIKK
ncbi:penicillin-binding transpeptidase domain-containing protein [Blattabacterium cuenoti]|uniref:penicillin-binding transpeptidase domain-containing protein n=1 Tax=Blattabacterium cuenoti TaxID=1653831 RepID=UPI00163CA140|nr:penicillin-binding transpeptidase domain-containing protein [Blattabacterium cuenoti]